MKFCLFTGAVVLFVTLISSAHGEPLIPIPGSPKGDLPTQLLQSRTYCRGLERKLQSIEQQFPMLAVEVVGARSSWESSPFAIGCDAIEKDIIEKAGEKGRLMLQQLDETVWEETKKIDKESTFTDALAFLLLVDRRAKGDIEVDMVRGNLLWQYKPYQERPEKEMSSGYVRNIKHTVPFHKDITFQVPMSWKIEDSPKPELMSFRNCYGHGNIWMTVLVSPTLDAQGQGISAQECFDNYSEETLRNEYDRIGIKLNSFLKTKVNGMPALLFTREQLYEQLDVRATRAAQVIRVFSGSHMISFQINTLGPEGETTAAVRIKKNEMLFKMMGGSMRIMDK